jgi:CCR4-NOT transcription complex subunit 3
VLTSAYTSYAVADPLYVTVYVQYLTWFQRHQEPTKTTDEYEQGTYKYFDGEQKWAEEIRPNFTFEYSFLEDEVQSS